MFVALSYSGLCTSSREDLGTEWVFLDDHPQFIPDSRDGRDSQRFRLMGVIFEGDFVCDHLDNIRSNGVKLQSPTSA